MSDPLMRLAPLQERLSAPWTQPVQDLELLLDAYVDSLSRLCQANLFEYLAHPLRLHLQARSSRARQLCLDGLKICLEHPIDSRMMLVLAEELAKSAAEVQSPFCSEETRLAAVGALHELLRHATAMDAAFWNANKIVRGLFGWILSQLLERIVAESSKPLRLAALECAACLFALMQSEPKVAATFLPGYLSVLQRVVCGDYKQGAALTQKALLALTDAVEFFFFEPSRPRLTADPFANLRGASHDGKIPREENALATSPATTSGSDQQPDNVSQMTFLTDPNEPEWLDKSMAKCVVIIQKSVPYVHRSYAEEHDDPAIRQTLVECCGRLALLREDLVAPCAVTLADILVLYVTDEWPSVTAAAGATLERLAKSDRNVLLARTVSESLHNVIVALPRLVRVSIESEMLTKLRLVTGYGRYLGAEGFPVVLSVSPGAVMEAVLQSVRIDRRDGSAKAIVAIEGAVSKRDLRIADDGTIEGGLPPIRLPAPLMFCTSVSLEKAVFEVCAMLAQDARCSALVLGLLMSRMEALAEDTAESFIVLAHMIHRLDDNVAVDQLVTRVLDVIFNVLAPKCDSVPLVLAMACYFIAYAVKRMDKLMQSFVRDLLPFLLNCLGHPSDRVSDMAWVGLEYLTLAMDETSVHIMIQNHADYVVDRLVKDLRIAQMSEGDRQRVPFAVYGILRHSPTNTSWLLDDILNETIALLDASAKRDEDLIVFAKILSEIAAALRKAVEEAQMTEAPQPLPHVLQTDAASDKGKEEASEDNGDEEDEWSKPATPEQAIATRILSRIRNFVPSRELRVQLDALKCIQSCLLVLAQSRKELLPGIYAVWDPLMKRLQAFNPQNEDDLALIQVPTVLGLTARLGTDFLSGEKFEQMWKSYSRICKWGLDCAQRKLLPTSFAFRVQKALLESMVEFGRHVPIRRTFEQVDEMMLRFQGTVFGDLADQVRDAMKKFKAKQEEEQ